MRGVRLRVYAAILSWTVGSAVVGIGIVVRSRERMTCVASVAWAFLSCWLMRGGVKARRVAYTLVARLDPSSWARYALVLLVD